ncbi:unnamed protein product [Umbelopsis sp. WA50703]
MNMFPRQDTFKYPDSTSPQVDEMMLQMCGRSDTSEADKRVATPDLTDASEASLASSNLSTFADDKQYEARPSRKFNSRTSLLINTKLRSMTRTAFRSPSSAMFNKASLFSLLEKKDTISNKEPLSAPDSSNAIHYHSFSPINELNNFSCDRLQWIKNSPVQNVDVYVRQQAMRPEPRLSFLSSGSRRNQNVLKVPAKDLNGLNVKVPDKQPTSRPAMKASLTMPSMRDIKSPNGVFYCRVLKVSNMACNKEFKVYVQMEVNGIQRTTSAVVMGKSGKHSACAVFDEAFLFDVDGPFTCKLAVRAHPVRNRVALQTIKRRESSRSLNTASGPEGEIIFGLADLHYEKVEGMEKSIRSFSLGRDRDIGSNKIEGEIELQLGIHLDVAGRVRESRSQGGLSGRVYADYLTVHTRGKMLPKWIRYWAVVDTDDLILYDFTYQEDKEPVAIINLNHVRNISRADDRIVLGATGFSLDMDHRCVSNGSSEKVQESEEIDYKMLMIADSTEKAAQWKEIFFEYVNVLQTMGVAGRQIVSNEESGIDLRYLW